MKRFVMLLAAGIAALVLSACVSPGAAISIPTPAQLATNVCPIVQADLTELQSINATTPILSAAQASTLANVIIPGNAAVCAAGATVNVTDLQTFNTTVFPAIIGLVNASTLPAATKLEIGGGLTLVQPILAAIVNGMPAATSSIASSAPVAASSAAASVPVAASQ